MKGLDAAVIKWSFYSNDSHSVATSFRKIYCKPEQQFKHQLHLHKACTLSVFDVIKEATSQLCYWLHIVAGGVPECLTLPNVSSCMLMEWTKYWEHAV